MDASVHLNGRVYDPLISKFLSGDPHIKDPLNGQNYNRYSYVLNNPMNLTDPTGFEDAPASSQTTPTKQCDDICKSLKAAAKNGTIKIVAADGSIITISTHDGVRTTTFQGASQSLIDSTIGTLKNMGGKFFNETVGLIPGVSKFHVDEHSAGAMGGGALAMMIGGEEEAGVKAGTEIVKLGEELTNVAKMTADELRHINSEFSTGKEVLGRDASSVVANMSYRSTVEEQAATAIRDIAEGHLFQNGNKRTAQEIAEKLLGPNANAETIRNVIDRASRGEFKSVDEITAALKK